MLHPIDLFAVELQTLLHTKFSGTFAVCFLKPQVDYQFQVLQLHGKIACSFPANSEEINDSAYIHHSPRHCSRTKIPHTTVRGSARNMPELNICT
jgi:hypothetical protein